MRKSLYIIVELKSEQLYGNSTAKYASPTFGRVFIRRNLFMVYVISQDGKPLMPCSDPIARLLLKQGKAKVKKREPFTIKLTYETTNYTQGLTLGVDTGSGTIGTAVSKDNGDIVYMSEVVVRNDITDQMTQRAKYRRNGI